jgi:hypothetical protein
LPNREQWYRYHYADEGESSELIDKFKGGKLHKRNACFLLDKQFWPGVSFGFSSMCVPFEELEECLMRIYYDMLPLCGIQISV